MSAAMEDGLHVDRVLSDPLAVPQGLAPALRRMERAAREQRAALAPLAAREDAVEPVRAALRELDRFLGDASRSPLLRALRRPLRQIAPGTPGWRTLESCWKGIAGRGAAAAELQAALDGIRAAVARVRDRFSAELPRTTGDLLRRERLEEADLARVGRAQDVAPLHLRLRRAEHALEGVWARVDPGAEAELELGASWREAVSPGELLALLRLRLRERDRLLHERDGARTLRRMAARQVQALGEVRHGPARRPVHAVGEGMGRLLIAGRDGAPGGEDLALWSELLGAAADVLHHPAGAAGWTARLDPPPSGEERGFGSTRFVVPIDDVYVLITAGLRSCVRVADRRVELDGMVECHAFLEPGDAETVPMAELDVRPLFDGFAYEPAWYATRRRARLQVIARHGAGWIAKVAERGELVRSEAGAWRAERRNENDRLRVLGTLAAPAAAEPLSVGPGGEEARAFCGLLSVPVATPLAECAVGWLRLAGQGGGAAEAVAEEEACFRAIACQVPLTVPVRAGRGRLEGRDAAGPLYVPPLGVRSADLPPLRAWLHEASGRALLEGVARLWLRLVRAGFGLGVYHEDALVFSLGWPQRGQGDPAAHATVAEAPFVTRLGRYHRRPAQDEASIPRWTGLGCHVLPPAVALGDVALPATEAQSFALFALDATAREPLPLSGIVPAEALAEVVADHADHFGYPALAVRLAEVLRPRAETQHVVEWIKALADSRTA